MHNTAIVILAAGSSSRLGKPKQLLSFHNTSFIQHVTGEALKANLYPLVVVTGAGAEEVAGLLHDKNAVIVFNEYWQQGMASSITTGLSKLLSLQENFEDVIIAVCDQPFVSAELFQWLIKKKVGTGKGIVACAYADTAGVPVLFGRQYIEDLLQLRGEEGAKKLLKLYQDDVATVLFPQGVIDIDTQEDYAKLT